MWCTFHVDLLSITINPNHIHKPYRCSNTVVLLVQFQLIMEFGGDVVYGFADLSVHEEADQY